MALIPIVQLAILEEDDRQRISRVIIRPKRINAFDYPDSEFISQFRLDKELCAELIEKLRPALDPKSSRKNVLSVETKVLCALRFYAIGGYQKCIGNDISSSMCQRSVSETIKAVTNAINELLFDEYIKFPVLEREREMIKKEFFEYSGFPGVVGALDCTHVAIIAPPDDGFHNERNYVNRKGFHSLNVQLVCDMHLKIMSMSARFPGCTHDAYIWRMSRLRDWFYMNSSSLKNTWLLGDSGYPLEPWLMTPTNGTSTADDSYNVAHKRGRNVIERCNGVLKSRFRCLLKHRTLHYSPTIAGMIVNACAVLHNMCVEKGITIQEIELDPDDLPFDSGLPDASTKNAECIRNRLLNIIDDE